MRLGLVSGVAGYYRNKLRIRYWPINNVSAYRDITLACTD